MTTWVVVADTGRARIFEAGRKLDELVEVQGFVHGMHRDKAGANPHGHAGGGIHHGLESAETLKEHEVAASATALAGFLLQAFNQERFRDMVLVAAPDFLGELRKVLDVHVQAVISRAIDKDLTRYSTGELEVFFRKL